MARRYLSYALLIVAVVAGSLLVLTREPPPGQRPPGSSAASQSPDVPSKPWTPSAENDGEANAGFSADSDRSDLLPLAGRGAGAEWPQFNGAARDNRSSDTGLLAEWPEEGPPLAWTAKGCGMGYASVAVANGVIYTMGNKGPSEAVMALDLGTGQKIWSTPIAWASRLAAGDGPRSTPAVAGDALLALGGNGDLACLERKTGTIRWQKNILREFGGHLPAWGYCESILVDGDRVICTPGGEKATIVALDVKTGDAVWTALVPEKDRAGYSSAVVAEAAGVRQYVQFTAGGTVAVRAADGGFLWRENSASNPSANCSSPLVAGDLVFSASNYGTGGALVRLSPEGSGIQAKLVYQTRDMKSHHGDMVIVDGLVFGSDDPGVLTCLDLTDGRMKWQNRSVGKGAVTWADGRIYLRSEQGPVALVEAEGSGYRERGRFDQPARSNSQAWAHPVVAGGRLLLRDQDLLLCYDVKVAE